MEVITFENVEKLNIFAAEKFVEIAKDSIAERGQFTVALSGGSTPKKLYSLLAEEPFRSQIEWKKVFQTTSSRDKKSRKYVFRSTNDDSMTGKYISS